MRAALAVTGTPSPPEGVVGIFTTPTTSRAVTRPFLIMHGTADPTISLNESLKFSNALRFNEKTAFLLAHPGEGHHLSELGNRKDFTVRFYEFFDHYLRGAPAAKWMTEGVPFLKKEVEGL